MSAIASVIPAFTPLRAWKQQRTEILAAIERVLDSGQVILGPEVDAFENEFSRFVGAKHAVGVASGTDALIMALRACNIGQGAEVLTVANGPVPTVSAIRAVGAQPRFVDVDAATLQMCPAQLTKRVSPTCRCVLVVHMYGQVAPIDAIAKIAKEHALVLIEDCAHAHGSLLTSGGGIAEHVGLRGAVGCFSFYPTKNLGAIGDGGMCVTNDSGLASSLRIYARYGFRGVDRVAVQDGLNSRLDELQAAVLRIRLRLLAEAVERRQQIALRYLTELGDKGLRLPTVRVGTLPSWHQFVVRASNREQWLAALAERGVQCGVHYQHPLHRMPAFEKFSAGESLPRTEEACREVFSLPMFPELRNEEVDQVIRAVHAVASATSAHA